LVLEGVPLQDTVTIPDRSVQPDELTAVDKVEKIVFIG
jgi:hypothetical protein